MRTILPMLAFVGLAGCSASVYVLPPPGDADDAPRSLDPAADAEAETLRFYAAQAALRAFYTALAAEDAETAWSLLSNETRLLLDHGSDGDGETALLEGRVTIDGTAWTFDPVDLFVVRSPVDWRDTMPGESEIESARRKEIFVVSRDETVRRVVMIYEGDAWRVHAPSWPRERLVPGDAS